MTHSKLNVDDLVMRCRALPNGLYAFDGYQGSGKSTIANEVAAVLSVPIVALDDFLVPHRGSFVECLRYTELGIALRQRPLVVEGVCLRAVMARLGMKPDVHVYVRGRVPPQCEPRGKGALAREVFEYHQVYRPEESADLTCEGPTTAGEAQQMESDRVAVDIAFIHAKTRLALALAGGGMLALIIGLAVLMYGVTGNDQTLMKAAGVEVSASGLGGVIMATSVVWALLAYKSRPTYARVRQLSEEFDSEARLVRRHEHESSTQSAVEERRVD